MNWPLLLVIGIVVMLLLAISIIFFVVLYQRRVITHQLELKNINTQKELELIQAAIKSEEDERLRIASELHDDVNATLASARLFLYKHKDALFDENSINQSKELVDESIAKIRDISHKLQPVTLQLGLYVSLRAMIEKLNRSGKIAATYEASDTLPRMPDNVELAAYRIAQELIVNMIKHANVTQIHGDVRADAKEVTIRFEHDGIGMTQDVYEEQIYKRGATGLKNIVNRSKAINASLSFYKADPVYNVELRIPLT